MAAYLNQNNMRDCADTVQRLKIDGRRFLNLSDTDLNKFNLIHRPQLQKIVQDIKKNDDSLFNRLKRIKKKGPPKVPARDYQGDAAESEMYSDSDFDSDTYEDPQGDHDDNYEPPPRSEGFSVSPSITNPREQYVDSCRGRPMPSFHLPQRNKPPSLHTNKHHRHHADNDDYIEPKDEADDNYIHPTEKTPTKTRVNRGVKPCVPARLHSPDFYEVPDVKENCQFNKSRRNTTLQLNTQMIPPKASPRMQIRRPTETNSEDEYEMCDADDDVNKRPEETRTPSIPTPRPRDLKKSNPASMPKANVSHRDTEADSTMSPPTTGFHRVKMPLPRQIPAQGRGATRDAEEEAGVYRKVWYAGSCDRRTAEDALIRSAKDGSFLLRKSSGVDAQQPYTLVVFYSGRVYNIPVRYITSSKQFALGKEKQGEERFSSVSDIIENHQNHPLVLVDSQNNTKDSTKLKHAVKP